jgi:hypothetical protein
MSVLFPAIHICSFHALHRFLFAYTNEINRLGYAQSLHNASYKTLGDIGGGKGGKGGLVGIRVGWDAPSRMHASRGIGFQRHMLSRTYVSRKTFASPR